MKAEYSPLLSADEERELAGRIKTGDQAARRQLILAHLRLIVGIARRYRSNKVPLDDLIQEGNLGLIRATEDFDPDVHDCRFAAYAEIWARAFIHRAIITYDSLVRVPEHVLLLRKQYRRAMKSMPATPAQVRVGAIDEAHRVALDLAVRRLNPVEAWVIRERYGVGMPPIPDETSWCGARPSDGVSRSFNRTYAEMERDCGLSARRIHQVEQAAIEKLRRVLELALPGIDED